MRKALLTLLCILTLSLAANAETWSYTPVSKCVTSDTTPQTATFNNISWDLSATKIGTGDYLQFYNQSPFQGGLAFGSANNPYSQVVMKTSGFAGKVIKSISFGVGRNQYANFTGKIKVAGQVVKELVSSDFPTANGYNVVKAENLEILAGEIEFEFNNSVTASGSKKNGALYVGTITIEYAEKLEVEKELKELTVDKFIVKAGEEIFEEDGTFGEGFTTVMVDPGTEITWEYDDETADVTYSYMTIVEDEDGDEVVETFEGNKYLYTGEEPAVALTVMAQSANQIARQLMIMFKVPTECPEPTFNVKDGADVNIGDVITVDGNGAETTTLYVNGEPVEGLSWKVEANDGDEITLKAESTVTGMDGEMKAEKQIIVKAKVMVSATFDFSTYKWESGSAISTTALSNGFASLTFSSGCKYYTSNTSARVYANGFYTVSVPSNYYISKITMTGTFSGASCDSNEGSISSGVWTPKQNVYIHEVKISRGSANLELQTIKVEWAPVPVQTQELPEYSWGAENYIVKYGSEFKPVFNNEKNVEVVFSSSNEAVAKFNENNELEIKGIGTAVITASNEENDEFYAGSEKFELLVYEVSDDAVKKETDLSSGYANGDTVETVNKGEVKYVFAKSTGANEPKYYDSGNAIRMYSNNTLTVSVPEYAAIEKIVFTFSSVKDFKNILSYSGEEGALVEGTWYAFEKGLTSVEFTAADKTAISKIEVVCTEDLAELEYIEVNGEYTFEHQGEDFHYHMTINDGEKIELENDGDGYITVKPNEHKNFEKGAIHKVTFHVNDKPVRPFYVLTMPKVGTMKHGDTDDFEITFTRAEGVTVYISTPYTETRSADLGYEEFKDGEVILKDGDQFTYYAEGVAENGETIRTEKSDPITTLVSEIAGEDMSEAKVYDLNGREVKGQLTPGIYVFVKGSKSFKVVVR